MSKKPSQYLGDQLRPFIAPFRFNGSGQFHLKSHKTSEKGGLDKDKAEKILDANRKRLSDFQEKLYAQDRWSVLLILQAWMRPARTVPSRRYSTASTRRAARFIRSSNRLPTNSITISCGATWSRWPQRGHIGIFNRSHYEECLVTRVHREILAKEKLPSKLVTRNIWRERFDDISAFERYLSRNGTVILKFFLNISKEEQRKRFSRPAGGAFEELEIFDGRRHRACAVAPLHGRLSGPGQAHLDAAGAMVRGARRSQMVRAGGDRLGDRQHAGKSELRFPRTDKASLQVFKQVREALLAEGKGG